MKGGKKVIKTLQDLLAYELSARDQYFIHSRMYEDWGFGRLHERLNHEMQEETDHASKLISRILFLEGTPDLAEQGKMKVGSNPKEMLENDLEMELYVVGAIRKAIALCENENDYVSRELLESLLDDTEEDHVYWLEQQLRLIKTIGMENYLQSQMGATEA
ncbi:bacterioferritin [Magnetofaba australis]|uniref:Bacterioferritin n=1 Tax=Magnetofaba australis IT-1 TaxID=1434232 RepID=A0A1Y2K1F2_9PROT|nr:bacterioferritin [Magnetofaba australis]OSM01802.1 putative Bacterioferritin [Magnetofaba australis IT-1]